MSTVLVVDDSKTIIAALTRFLKTHGYGVVAADNFVAIPKLIEEQRPEAIVLDLNMPALTGEQIGKFLRRYGYQGRLIIYSSEADSRLEKSAGDLGAHAWVSKNGPVEALLAALN